MSQQSGAVYIHSRKSYGLIHPVELAFSSRNTRTLITTPTPLAAQLSGYKMPWLSFLTMLISLLHSALQKPHHLFFLCSWVHLPPIFLELCGPDWSDSMAQNRELVLYYVTQQSLFIKLYCLGLKSRLLSKNEIKIFLSCQNKEISWAVCRVPVLFLLLSHD